MANRTVVPGGRDSSYIEAARGRKLFGPPPEKKPREYAYGENIPAEDRLLCVAERRALHPHREPIVVHEGFPWDEPTDA
jgi:hypothetical protein